MKSLPVLHIPPKPAEDRIIKKCSMCTYSNPNNGMDKVVTCTHPKAPDKGYYGEWVIDWDNYYKGPPPSRCPLR